MERYEINVEFGKCTIGMDEEELISHKNEVETILKQSIRSGNLYFEVHRKDSNHIPFLLTPYSADVNKLRQEIDEKWKLTYPRIVLFVIAETEDSPSDEYRKLSRKLVKGLLHVLNTTEMWLCTDGLNYGLSKDIGKAFESELSRRKSVEKGVHKGISTFPEIALIGISRRDILPFSNKLGDSKLSSDNDEETVRDVKDICNCFGYFIIVEDTTENKNGVSHFLLNFARHFTEVPEEQENMNSPVEMETNKSHVMILLLHGKISQVDMIFEHLKLGLPLVVCEGSGGLADILAYAYHQDTCRPEGTNIAEYTELVLKPQVRDRITEFYPSLPENKVNYFAGKIFDCIRYFKHNDREFITILNLDHIEFYASKLPHLLLKAVFKAETSEAAKTVEQMKKDLLLTMDWNSVDVAMEEVFSKERSNKFKIDNDTFSKALIKSRREDFVSLFLNQGFVLHKFLNSSNLLTLFQNSLNREFFRSVVWENVLGFGSNVEISRTFLDSKLIILIEELTGIQSMLNSYELDWSSKGVYDDRSPEEAERKALAVIILWAILSHRIKLVKLLMRHSEQPIHLALVCSIILKKLENHVTDLSLKKEMKEQSIEFSKMASSTMTLCYESVPCRARDSLKEKNRVWSNKDLLELSAFARNKMFLAHPCCQKFLDELFMEKIRIRDLPYGDITIPLWIKVILCNFLIFPMFIWIRFEPIKQKETPKVDNTSSTEESVAEPKKPLDKFKEPGFFTKFYYLWSAPISKFWVFMVFYVLFLVLFSFAVIWPACGNVFLDFFTCVWIATIILDTAYNVYILNNEYSSMPLTYKIIEIAIMTIFLFIYVMSRLIFMQDFMSAYATKVVLCLALLYFYYRLIFIAMPISSELGPLLYRVKRMIIVDFMSYIRVTILVIISNGVVLYAVVFPDYPLSWDLFRLAFYDAFISFFLTPATNYGEPNPKCIKLQRHPNGIAFYGTPLQECKVGRYLKYDCPNPGVWPYLFGIQYFIILRLILLVLLFALFSNTAKKLDEIGKYIWKYQRYELVINFSNRLTLPPPLCIITFIYMFFKYICRKLYSCCVVHVLRRREQASKTRAIDNKLDENDFMYWKTLSLQQYNETKQEKVGEMTMKMRLERINAILNALNHQRRTLRDLDGHLNETQIEIKIAHQYLERSEFQTSVTERLKIQNVPQVFSRISPYPNTVVSRFPVSDNHVPWECQWTAYDPIAFTLPKDEFPKSLRSYVDVDIQRLRELGGESFRMPDFTWNTINISPGGFITDRESWITDKTGQKLKYELDFEYLPKNPRGRTGLRGRGCLPRWGPNHYAFVVITQCNDQENLHNYMDVVLVENDEELSLPGRYVHTENQYEIIRSFFKCNDVWKISDDMTEYFKSLSKSAGPKKETTWKKMMQKSEQKEPEEFFSEKIKLGYMDEATNTDQAWCEAEVWHYHYNIASNIESGFKGDMQWHLLNELILTQIPIGQAAMLHAIAKSMKAKLEVV